MRELNVQQLLALITGLALFSYAALPKPLAAAESHVVDLSALHQEMYLSQQARAKDIEDIERVLSLPAAQDALAEAHLDAAQVTVAIAELDDEELSRLADRARAAEQDVEGGFIVGVLALIGLIVVIVVVLSIVQDDE